jgi:hypothetical protein
LAGVALVPRKIQRLEDRLVPIPYLALSLPPAAAAARHLHQALQLVVETVVRVAVELMRLVKLPLVLETLLALLHLKETTEELEQPDRHLEVQAAVALEQPAQTVALQAATVAQELRLAFPAHR